MRLKPKIIFAFGFFLLASVWLLAQTITGGGLAISCNAVTTTGACTAFALAAPSGNLPAAFTWQTITTGGPASVSITLEGSIDGTTFSTLDTSTSTSGELRSVTGKPVRQLRCNLGTFSGGASPSMTCQFTVTSAGTGGGGGGGGGGTVTNTGGALTLNSPVLGAGGNDTKVSTGITSNGASELDLGLNGTASGVLGLKGSTSGTASISAPVVAGTTTNPITLSNVIDAPIGSASAVAFGDVNAPGNGMFFPSSSLVSLSSNTTEFFRGNSVLGLFINTEVVGWSSGAPGNNAADTALSRSAAGVVSVGSNSTAGDTTGKVKAAGYISVGTTFTSNAGCSETTLVGGATAGRFTVGSASCTIIITMGNSATAPNGWDCSITDLTTAADAHNPRLSASNATTVTFITGTVVSSDVLSFHCEGY